MIITVVFYVFVVCTVLQTIYYLFFSTFLFGSKKENNSTPEIPVSVIVYTKNQAKDLQKFLPSILKQEYSLFEIVIINNASIDKTSEVIGSISKEYSNIKVVTVKNNEAFWASKKYALTLGIKASKYNNLLFVNVNSKLVSENWISEMSSKFSSEKTIVLGYEKYKKENSLVNIFVRFQNLLTAIKCFSFIKQGSPFMAFGNNLGYQKSTFFNVNGFINHMKISAGEADLFIKDAANKSNTTFFITRNSFVEIDAPKSFLKWYSRERKALFIKKKYKFKHRFLLGLFTFTKLLFYILAITLFFLYPSKIILTIVVSYFLLQYIIVGFSAKKLKETQIIFFFPFLEIGLILFQISIFIANLTSKPNH